MIDFDNRPRVTRLKNLIVDEASLVTRGANEEAMVVIAKKDGIPAGMTEKEWVWESEIVPAVDKFQDDYGERQRQAYQRAGGDTNAFNRAYKHQSREQLVGQFFQTPVGKTLYDKYVAASDVQMQVRKSEEQPERQTLETYAWDKMDAIAAKRYPELTPEAGVAKASRENAEWGEIYAISVYSAPLNQVPFNSRSISKSKSDAIQVWKREIDSLAHKAGV